MKHSFTVLHISHKHYFINVNNISFRDYITHTYFTKVRVFFTFHFFHNIAYLSLIINYHLQSQHSVDIYMLKKSGMLKSSWHNPTLHPRKAVCHGPFGAHHTSNQQHHPSYDNAACVGLDISTACHPPSLYEESTTSIQTSMVGKNQEAAPKPDGLIQSNTTSILLASTPSMLPRWSVTDPQWKAFVCDLPTLEPEHGP